MQVKVTSTLILSMKLLKKSFLMNFLSQFSQLRFFSLFAERKCNIHENKKKRSKYSSMRGGEIKQIESENVWRRKGNLIKIHQT